MGDAARAQAVASKSCLYRRNGLEISIPFLDSALSHWLLNLHVAVGDWPKLRSVAPENEDHPKPPFSNRLRPSTRPKRAPTRFAAHANGRHCSRRARSAHATPISEIIEMNGTSQPTMSPAPTGPTPAPRASPVSGRLRLGDDVSAFWRFDWHHAAHRRSPSAPFPPSLHSL